MVVSEQQQTNQIKIATLRFSKMCKVQMLRALLNERLSAAVEEILVAVASTIAEYEEELCRSKEEIERQRQLLDALFKAPLHQADVSPEEQLEAEPRYVKEEEEEEEEEQSDLPSFSPELPRVKEEKKEEEVHVREQLEPLADLPGQRKGGGKRKALGPPEAFGGVNLEPQRFLWEDGASVAVEIPDESSSSSCGEGDRKKSSSYAWTRADKQALAAFFQEFPMFYDSCLDEFKEPKIKRAAVKQLVREQFEHKGRPAPTYKQVMGFLKNYRTRFVKLNGKRCRQADEHLTATEQWILDNFAYLRPHIKKRRGRPTRQSPSRKASSKTRRRAPDGGGPSASAACGRDPARESGGPSDTVVPGNDDRPLSQLWRRADEATRQRHGAPLSSREVKRFAYYLKTLMMNIPEGQT